MSILNYLTEYSRDYKPPSIAWRERRVWHKTKTGEMHYVKIKSLTPEEQMKFKPLDLIRKNKKAAKFEKTKKKKAMGGETPMTTPQQVKPPEEKIIEGDVLDFYYGVKDLGKYKEFKKDELIQAT